MRASSFSDSKVIAFLNRYFVPVFISNEDLGDWADQPRQERDEVRRIYVEALNAGLSPSTVGIYILTPEGRTLDAVHVVKVYKPEELLPVLERAVEKLKTRPGDPVVPPATLSKPPQHEPDSLVLHLTARVLKAGSGWDAFPAENWIVLSRTQWTKFLPPGHLSPGKSWDIDKEAAAALLTYFYPATENNDISKNRIEQEVLKGRVISIKNGVIRVRLSGQLKMKHAFYHKDDANVVEAGLAGYLDLDPRNNVIRSFRLVTDEASYRNGTFAVAVRSAP
jgi:hypothetical protein